MFIACCRKESWRISRRLSSLLVQNYGKNSIITKIEALIASCNYKKDLLLQLTFTLANNDGLRACAVYDSGGNGVALLPLEEEVNPVVVGFGYKVGI